MNHPHKWTLEQLRYCPTREFLKYVRDDLVEGISPRAAEADAPLGSKQVEKHNG